MKDSFHIEGKRMFLWKTRKPKTEVRICLHYKNSQRDRALHISSSDCGNIPLISLCSNGVHHFHTFPSDRHRCSHYLSCNRSFTIHTLASQDIYVVFCLRICKGY